MCHLAGRNSGKEAPAPFRGTKAGHASPWPPLSTFCRGCVCVKKLCVCPDANPSEETEWRLAHPGWRSPSGCSHRVLNNVGVLTDTSWQMRELLIRPKSGTHSEACVELSSPPPRRPAARRSRHPACKAKAAAAACIYGPDSRERKLQQGLGQLRGSRRSRLASPPP